MGRKNVRQAVGFFFRMDFLFRSITHIATTDQTPRQKQNPSPHGFTDQGRLKACANRSANLTASGRLSTVCVKLSSFRLMVSEVLDKNLATFISTTRLVVAPAVIVYGLLINGNVLKSVSAPG